MTEILKQLYEINICVCKLCGGILIIYEKAADNLFFIATI